MTLKYILRSFRRRQHHLDGTGFTWDAAPQGGRDFARSMMRDFWLRSDVGELQIHGSRKGKT